MKTMPWTQIGKVVQAVTVVLMLNFPHSPNAMPTAVLLPPETRCNEGVPLTDKAMAGILEMSVDTLNDFKRARSYTNELICSVSASQLQRSIGKFINPPRPDSPQEWAEFRAMQQRDESGTVKPDGLIHGLAQRKQIVSLVQPTAGISQTGWTALGPGNIGGRVRAAAVHPANSQIIFIGSVSGGIWKTTDGGASWSPVNDFMGNLSVSSIVFDPTDTTNNTLYAGTGEGFYPGGSFYGFVRGAGVFKSIDGGVTWAHLSSTSGSAWYYVNRLAINSNGVLLAAVGQGSQGIYLSSDNGNTWTLKQSGQYTDVRFDPNDPTKAVAGSSNGMVAYTTNTGATWTSTTISGGGRVELAYARANANVVYASVDVNSGKIFKSTDGGATWAAYITPAHLGNQGWYDNTIWVDPTDSAHLLVGGLDIYRITGSPPVATKISTWYYSPSSPHADHHIIFSDPGYNGTTNRRVYFGNDGGVQKAEDINTANSASTNNGWTNLNNGLAITQFYSGAGKASVGGGRFIGGTQDNGSLMTTGSTNWTTFFGGDGGYSAVDPADGNYLYGEYVYLQLHRNTTGGAGQSSFIDSGITDAGSSANFIAPFILDPNNANRMLAGGQSLWLSTNVKAATPTWSKLANRSSAGYDYISAIAVAEGDSTKIWYGTNNGTLAYSNNGTNFTTLNLGTPGRMVLRILIDKTNPYLVYVSYGGYSVDNLYKLTSADSGATWTKTNITGNLPATPIRGVAHHPTNANWLYAGTEVGIFDSTDGGNNWFTVNDGPANVSVDELFWYDNSTLVAATHGRGMFKRSVISDPFVKTFTIFNDGNSTLNVSSIQKENNSSWLSFSPAPPFSISVGNSQIITVTVDPSLANFGTNTDRLIVYSNDPVKNPYPGGVNITLTRTDTIAPVTTASLASGTYNSIQSVTLSCSDGTGSGCDKIYYTTDGTTPTTTSTIYTAPISITASATLKFFANDMAGNSETVKSEAYTIDTTAPIGTISINSSAAYTNSTVATLTLSCADTNGCSQMQFSNDNATWSTAEAYTTSKVWTLASVDGTKTVYAKFKDIAGNWSTAYSDTIVLDTTAPTTAASPAGGTYTSAQNVTLSCSDGTGSGCDKIYYTTNGTIPSTSSTVYSDAISISATMPLKFFAVDNTGNSETVKTETYNITTPVLYTLNVNKAGAGSGSVISTPPGIECGAYCSTSLINGTVATLTAIPDGNSLFAGWSGDCSGTDLSTSVTMSSGKACTATFIVGLVGEYYNNSDLTGLGLVRTDPVIAFDWGTGSPDPAIDADTFAVRWTGKLQVDYNETYTFHAVTDDGVRLWTDGHLVLDYWQTGGVSINNTMDLMAGLHDIKVEFYEDTGTALAQLYWSSPSTPYAIIPNDHLYPPDGTGSSPVLEWAGGAGYAVDGVEPETGYTTTVFTYRVKYTDADGNPPMSGFPRTHILKGGVEITGSPFVMSYESGDYTGGAIYSFSKTLTAGADYTYYFDAVDNTGLQAVATPVRPTPTAPVDAPDVAGVDLFVSFLSASATAKPGQIISVTETTKNKGTWASAASTTKFFWSSDIAFDAGDSYLGSRSVPSLAPGATSSGSTSVTVPSSIACTDMSTFYIIAIADADNVIAESNDTNNSKSKSIKLGPDLIISTLSAPATSGAGMTITITDTPKNQGGCTSGTSATDFYLSANNTYDTGDTYLGSRSVPVISAGATDTGSTSVAIPANTSTGTYYIVAKSDGANVVAETNETNNNKSKSIKLGPDLIISSLSAPSTSGAGMTITISSTTKNSGAGTAGASTTSYYLSANTTYETGDTYLGGRPVPSLAAGAVNSGGISVTIPVSTLPGPYYIIGRSDSDGVVPETNETNNIKYRLITTQ